jgi:hypothetical protein
VDTISKWDNYNEVMEEKTNEVTRKYPKANKNALSNFRNSRMSFPPSNDFEDPVFSTSTTKSRPSTAVIGSTPVGIDSRDI